MALGGWTEPHVLRWDFLDARPSITSLARHPGGSDGRLGGLNGAVFHSCTVPLAQDSLK